MNAPRLLQRVPLIACLGLAACASMPHIAAYQEAPLEPAPRSVALAVEKGEALPLNLRHDELVQALSQAGFMLGGEAPTRYRLTITAAVGPAKSGSFIPGSEGQAQPSWIARPDHSLRAHFTGGRVTRVNVVLIDVITNREVWHGTGTVRGKNAEANVHRLTGEVLAKLPR